MSELKEIHITDIEEFDSVDVVEVLVKVGDSIEINQPIVTLESEKAMMDFPSQYSGVVQKINVTEGSKVKEGDTLVTLEVQAENAVTEQTQATKTTTGLEDAHTSRKEMSMVKPETSVAQKTGTDEVESIKPQTITAEDSAKAYASPSVYKYARELGVDLGTVQGSGREHRVMKKDVQNYVRTGLQNNSGSSVQAKATASIKPQEFSAYGDTEAVELTKIQKLTAENMSDVWQTIPHVTHFDQADVTLLEQHRKQLADELIAREIKLTPLAFVIKALVTSLKQFPQFNASLDFASNKLILKKYFHVGIAVDTPHGLLVPVLRDVDKKSITQVASELMEISDHARERKLTAKQMSGASITISSLGNLGGQAFTPLINSPEVAILGLSKIIVKEKVTETGVVEQKLLPLSLSYDHRVINGADAARFCTFLKGVLEDIWKLIL